MTYGTDAGAVLPPIGMPTMTLPIRFITVLLPKSLLVPKKLGLQPKSASPPTIRLPCRRH